MNHAVVAPAEEEQVRNVGFAAMYPVHIVVDLGVTVRQIASGESAAFVAFTDSFGGCCRDRSGESGDIEGFGDTAGNDPADFCVTANTQSHLTG